MHRRSFRAMGTDVSLLLECDSTAEATAALDDGEAEVHRLDALLSRFRPESELSRLNDVRALDAGPELYELVELALAARERTGGAFDPTVHDALVAAGYDRTFAEIDESRPAGAPVPCRGDVRLDARTRRIELGDGARLDLGGIAKGWAADRVCALLHRTGPALVDLGGDIAVRGLLGGRPWPVGVETPDGTITLALARGALATSGRDRRRWRREREEQHHVIDPSTGAPAVTDLVRATAFAASATDAEVEAKVLLLAGERAAAASGTPCVLVTEGGRTVVGGGIAA